VGSFALAAFGRIRKVHELSFAGSAGCISFALKRIFEVALVIDATDLGEAYVRWVRKSRTRMCRRLVASAMRISDPFPSFTNVGKMAAKGGGGKGQNNARRCASYTGRNN
jgi:hypothetical protein